MLAQLLLVPLVASVSIHRALQTEKGCGSTSECATLLGAGSRCCQTSDLSSKCYFMIPECPSGQAELSEVETTAQPEVEAASQPEVDATAQPEVEATAQPEVEAE